MKAIFPGTAWSYPRVRFWITMYAGLGAILLLWTGLKAVTIVKMTSPVTGVLGCGLWCLCMVWLDRARMPKAYRMHPLLLVLTLLTGLSMASVGVHTTVKNWIPN